MLIIKENKGIKTIFNNKSLIIISYDAIIEKNLKSGVLFTKKKWFNKFN